jgi:hypothetical protein
MGIDAAPRPCAFLEHTRTKRLANEARIEDLGQGDFVKVDCAACHHVALLAPEFLLRLGLSPQAKVLDLKERVRCRMRSEGTGLPIRGRIRP